MCVTQPKTHLLLLFGGGAAAQRGLLISQLWDF